MKLIFTAMGLLGSATILIASANASDPLPDGAASTAGYEVYWGDPHGHTNVSSDWRPANPAFGPAEYFQAARERGLDFAVITDHAEDISPAEWPLSIQAARNNDVPGFVPFLGFEVAELDPGCSGTTELHPDLPALWNVILPSIDRAVAFGHESMTGCGTTEMPASNLLSREAMWRRLRPYGAIGFYARPATFNGEGSNPWGCGSGPNPASPPVGLNEAGRYERLAVNGTEIHTGGGGNNEDRYEPQASPSSLLTMYRAPFAVLGSGNNHVSGPGQDGLTGVLAKSGDRRAIFEAMRAGRTYSVWNSYCSGDVSPQRLRVTLEVNQHLMGERFTANGDISGASLTVHLAANNSGRPIRSMVVLQTNVAAPSFEVIGHCEPCSSDTLDFSISQGIGTEMAYTGLVYLVGNNEAQAWTSPIWVQAKAP